MNNKLLVLTALEDTWGNSQEELFFLGEWCKKFERKHVFVSRSHKTNIFHWDDRTKLKKDYNYLETLHHRLLKSLSKYLNNIHRVNYSERYWQIILDPWLLSYVGIIFDRWETLRMAFNYQDKMEVIFLPDEKLGKVYLCWSEFMELVVDDYWNQGIYQRIIRSEYLENVHIKYNQLSIYTDMHSSIKKDQFFLKTYIKKSALYLLRGIDQLLAFITQNNKIVFVGSFFNLGSLIRLNLSIGQIPRLYLNEFSTFDFFLTKNVNSSKNERSIEQFFFNPTNKFEYFLNNWIIKDLPSSLIESYFTLNSKVLKLNISPKIIITANPHWGNIIAKFWLASQVNKGVKLVVLEHGGSLPAYKELFDFEEDIADSRGTWFLPYHSKHIQVPPSKIVGIKSFHLNRRSKKNKGYLCIVSSEHARYVYRLHFYPMAKQCLSTLDLIVAFYNKLHFNIQNSSRLKAYINQGWNTRARYSEVMGPEKIIKNSNLKQAMEYSHIIVCSYPETTFSEAMSTGVPTILLYPDHFYERNPISYSLIKILKVAKIIFTNSDEAAEHINNIWNDPYIWWGSTDTLNARAQFYKQALNNSSNWVNEWKSYIKDLEI